MKHADIRMYQLLAIAFLNRDIFVLRRQSGAILLNLDVSLLRRQAGAMPVHPRAAVHVRQRVLRGAA